MINTDAVIVGAGPTGLFCAHQLGIIGLKCEIVDNLDKIGGQCIELYPDKPIYDIPAIPECTGEELTNNLIKQIEPFNFKIHLNQRVDSLSKDGKNWKLTTSNKQQFISPNIIIAGGVGSFEPRKFSLKECKKYENNSVLYSVKDKAIFKEKTVSIFGGGDSALDWAIELSKNSKVILIHRREEFRGAQSSVNKVMQLAKENKVELFTKYQLSKITGDNKITLKFIEPTWIQLRNNQGDIILSSLMYPKDYYSYYVSDNYNVTTGNAGNIVVKIDDITAGKLGRKGEVIESFIINSDFEN